jgi:hypothetical protein
MSKLGNFFDGKRVTRFITDGSIGADFTSDTIPVMPLNRVGIDIEWTTADVVGTVYIQCTIAGNNFSDLPASSKIVSVPIAGTNGFQSFDIDCQAFSELRLFFDYTSGTAGTLQGYYLAKGSF